MDLNTMIWKIEERKREGKSIDDLRDDILGFLIAFRETPTGTAAIGAWATAFCNSQSSAESYLKYLPNTPQQLETFAAALTAIAHGKRKSQTDARIP